jgi:hypothetical protein
MPTQKTLDKYGITLEEWQSLLDKQGGICPICHKVPSTGRWVIDHEHKKGWKNLEPNERKKYIRGILCWIDNNKILTRGVTIERLENAVRYLKEYELKKS